MKKLKIPVALLFCSVLVISFTSFLQPQEKGFSLLEFKERRERLFQQISDGVIIVSNYSGPLALMRTNPGFFYLTGVDVPGAKLILIPEAIAAKSSKPEFWKTTLYLPPESPAYGVWDDPMLFPGEEAEKATGIENTAALHSFDTHIARAGYITDTVYLYYNPNTLLAGDFASGTPLIEKIKKIIPHVKIKNLSPFLDGLRWKKSPSEISVMKKGCDITVDAFKEVARFTRPGVYEYEVEALVKYIFRKNGSKRAAFTIIASGPNSCILHHSNNDRLMEDGDLLKIDIGTIFQSMSTDLTRTIPVSGKFTPEQRKIYEIVLRAQKKAISIVKPGLSMADVHKAAYDVIDQAGYGKYFNHGTCHTLNGGPQWQPKNLGLTYPTDYHNMIIPAAFDNPFVPGSMFTIEPGIYIHAKNIGIRIEDDILVTENGYEVLTKDAPKEIDEIERLMKEEPIHIK